MDRRSWPWKKKSSDKLVAATSLPDCTTVHADSAVSQFDQEKEEVRKPKFVQISVDTYSHLTGLEDQVKSSDEHVKTLEEEIKELNEKLTETHTEMTNKDSLVKQHAKVAEEAVSGWEKAEAEAAALKNHLESVTLLKLTAEDRASHLDGALKECMRQIRNLKEEHELKLHEIMAINTKQFEKVKFELESRIADLDHELMRSSAENAALSRSLQDRSSMLMKLSEEKSQAEAEIELLKSNIESCHKEINSLKYELHIATKEMEIRNEERNMSVRSAEAANKQHLEGVRKIAKLEAECQRLRGLVRKKLPGPAALAQMKLEVENLGRDHGDNRFRRSTLKPSASHLSSLPDISFDAVQKFHKENELLTERLVAMEEEIKMLKEALAMRNSELQASRSICAQTDSKLQSLEIQLRATGGHRSPSNLKPAMPIDGSMSQNVTSPPSVTSMSGDPNEDSVSCDGSWGTGLMSDLSHSKKDQSIGTIHKSGSANHLELMDDFLEMEKLAYASSDVNVAVSGVHASNNERPEIVSNGVPVNVTYVEDPVSKEHIGSDFPATHGPLEREVSGANPVADLQSRLRLVLESLSNETNIHKALEEIKQVLQEAYEHLHQQSVDLVVEDARSCKGPFDCENDAELTTEKVVISSLDSKPSSEAALSISQELSHAIPQIHDFVMVLGKGIKAVQGTCSDSEDLSRSLEDFSSMYKEVENTKASLSQFVIDLSQVLHKANGLHCNFLGYKISDAENANSDCIDKVVLPENKGSKDTSGDRYTSVESDPNSDLDIPLAGSPVPSSDLVDNSWRCSLEEFEQLKLEKNSVITELARCRENLESTKLHLVDVEHELAEVKSQLSSTQKLNSLAETQLKCMAESYKTLETRAEELQTVVNLLQGKLEGLRVELEEEKRSHRDALSRCRNLEEQLHRMESSQSAEVDARNNQERELEAASERLSQCQETIFLLGKQLNSLRPPTEMTGTAYRERHKVEDFDEEASVSNMNLQDIDLAESDAPGSPSIHRTGGESPIDVYNVPYSSDSEGKNLYLRSPTSLKSPKHPHAFPASSSTSPFCNHQNSSNFPSSRSSLHSTPTFTLKLLQSSFLYANPSFLNLSTFNHTNRGRRITCQNDSTTVRFNICRDGVDRDLRLQDSV